MIERLCRNCDNRMCKDSYPTMRKEYVKQCLDSNRSRFIPYREEEEEETKEPTNDQT